VLFRARRAAYEIRRGRYEYAAPLHAAALAPVTAAIRCGSR
jgi:hypothetical protein